MVQGQMTPASAQAGAPRPSPRAGSGATSVNAPVGRLRVIHVHQPFGEERRHVDVVGGGADEDLASPIQPSRSSRCGQSVGTLRKLPRWPQWMFDCNWLSRGSEQVNSPARGVSEPITMPVTASSGRLGSGRPVSST